MNYLTTVLTILGKLGIRQPDKAIHFIVGYLIGAMGASAGYPGTGTFVGIGAGWAKEKYDQLHPKEHTPDGWDAYATALGAVTGGYLQPLLKLLPALLGV
jgi:hypothetical protein